MMNWKEKKTEKEKEAGRGGKKQGDQERQNHIFSRIHCHDLVLRPTEEIEMR